jgi:hypothetical protein
MKDRTLWQMAWRAAHALGAAGLVALAAMLFLSLPVRAQAPQMDGVEPCLATHFDPARYLADLMTDQSPNDVFHASSFMQGHNAEYLEQLYARYATTQRGRRGWRQFFAQPGRCADGCAGRGAGPVLGARRLAAAARRRLTAR